MEIWKNKIIDFIQKTVSKNLKKNTDQLNKLTLPERLKQHIIDGEKNSLEDNLFLALKTTI